LPKPAVPTLSELTNHGRWLTDDQGRTVIVHGFNVVSKLAPYEPSTAGFGEDDAQFLEDHGFTAVRLGVIFTGVEPKPGVYDQAYLDEIEQTVTLLARHHIYSLLDFHQDLYNERFQGEGLPDWMVDDDGLPAQPQAGFPGNYFAMPALWRSFDHLWANDPGPQDKGYADWYAAAWRHVAQRFRGIGAVLGYDIFNEPFPGSPYVACFPPAGCPTYDGSLLKPFMTKVVNAIHAVDPKHIAFVEPWVTFDYSAPTYLGKVGRGPVGFSFHPYCLAALNLPVPDAGPVRTFCDEAAEGRTFDNAESQIDASGQVPLVTEFGATSDPAELATITRMSDEHAMGWLNWAYCECGDPTGAGSIESLVYDANKPPTGKNVNAGNLAILERPHPLVVAGTPELIRYDPETQEFYLRFSTKQPDGRRAARGKSKIYLPKLAYANGYRARVFGADVESAPNAPVLRIRSLRGAGHVMVRVRPVSR
jgi:endoglycosylceramidase